MLERLWASQGIVRKIFCVEQNALAVKANYLDDISFLVKM